MKASTDTIEDMLASCASLVIDGERVDVVHYAAALRRYSLIYGRVYECVRIDGTRELLDPALFVRTCSKCGRGFFEATSEPLLEAVARKRCLPCR